MRVAIDFHSLFCLTTILFSFYFYFTYSISEWFLFLRKDWLMITQIDNNIVFDTLFEALRTAQYPVAEITYSDFTNYCIFLQNNLQGYIELDVDYNRFCRKARSCGAKIKEGNISDINNMREWKFLSKDSYSKRVWTNTYKLAQSFVSRLPMDYELQLLKYVVA